MPYTARCVSAHSTRFARMKKGRRNSEALRISIATLLLLALALLIGHSAGSLAGALAGSLALAAAAMRSAVFKARGLNRLDMLHVTKLLSLRRRCTAGLNADCARAPRPGLHMVPMAGVEPACCHQRRILSPLRLPIPSHRQVLIHYSRQCRRLQVKNCAFC